jgi:hypothetical protein
MTYTTNRVAPAFVRMGEIWNGQSARGSVLENIANNQLWLAVQDCEMRAFYMGEMTNTAVKLTVRFNPYATWLEFFFLCQKDINATATTQAGIKVQFTAISGDTSYSVEIPEGEDLTTTGGSLSNDTYGWVRFVGRVSNTTQEVGARAIAVATASDAYTEHEIEITIDADVYVKTMQFRVLPAQSPITVP